MYTGYNLRYNIIQMTSTSTGRCYHVREVVTKWSPSKTKALASCSSYIGVELYIILPQKDLINTIGGCYST
jgi:hypothetical protein